MSKPKPITIWNIMALLVLIVAAFAVFTLDQIWVRSWASSGQSFPLGQRLPVELPQGSSLVYYESPHSVPRESVTLYLWDSEGDRVFLTSPVEDISYRLLLGGWSGRALWQLDLPAAGLYTFMCMNHNFADDSEIPAEDRVVFLKKPDSLAEMSGMRKVMQVTGASIAFTTAVGLYIVHGLALRKRRQRMAGPNHATPNS